MKQHFSVIILFVLIGLSSQALAEQPAQSMSLEAYLEQVRAHNPALARERAELEVARAELIEAKVLPNPSLGFETVQRAHGANTIDGAEYEITVEQPLELFGQRSARRKMAELSVEAAELEFEAAFLEVASQARLAFAKLLLAQQKAELFEELLSHIEQTQRVVQARAEEGAQSRYDVLRLELEAAELLAEQQELLGELREARIEATKFIATPGDEAPKEWAAEGAFELSNTSAPGSLKWAEIREQHPIMRAARRAQESAVQAVELARAERWPELDLEVGALFTTDDSSVNIIAGLGIELPIFDRAQGEIARAEASVLAASRALDLHEVDARAAFERAHSQFTLRQQALEDFREQTRDRLGRLRAMAEESYAAGHSGILELLDALETITTLKQAELEMAADLYQAHIELEAAAGRFVE